MSNGQHSGSVHAHALFESRLKLPDQSAFYRGKVRDVYTIGDDILVVVATDRISAFDVVLPRPIPGKGMVLNQLAAFFLERTRDIAPNWLLAQPHPRVSIGRKLQPIKIEMVIRAYLTGHAWREYRAGKRMLCGVPLPEGMREHDAFPQPIITPASKAEEGHDLDISREEILRTALVTETHYEQMERYTRALFARGTQMAAQQGLILVDTKYEFGLDGEGVVMLIDEIHTPDSSRYFYLDQYDERQRKGEAQPQLSKEFVREWLIAGGFQGLEGQRVPEMSDQFVQSVSERYRELYQRMTGQDLEEADAEADREESMQRCIVEALARLKQ